MFEQPYRSIRFDWLINQSAEPMLIVPDQVDSVWQPYPIPPELGGGGCECFNLAHGMSLFRAQHRILPGRPGEMIELAEVSVHFKSPVWLAQSARGGKIEHRDNICGSSMCFSQGETLFRQADQFHLTPLLERGSTTEMICLAVGISTFKSLLGQEMSERLMFRLGLESPPQARIHHLPVAISDLLHLSLPIHIDGRIRKLLIQARCLEYLGAISSHYCIAQESPRASQRTRQRAQEIHDFLISCDGRLPTLVELAERYGRSAKLLNQEFSQYFGMTIHAFILDHRLRQAHACIEKTDTPLKTLAAKLGYSQVIPPEISGG